MTNKKPDETKVKTRGRGSINHGNKSRFVGVRVPMDTYTKIEHIAKQSNMSISMAICLLLAEAVSTRYD